MRRYSADLLVLVGLLLLAGGLGLVYGPRTPIVFGLGLIAAVRFGEGKERRYLDGHPALCPDAASHWPALRESAARLVGLGGSLALSPDAGPRRRGRPALDLDALRSAARALVAERRLRTSDG